MVSRLGKLKGKGERRGERKERKKATILDNHAM